MIYYDDDDDFGHNDYDDNVHVVDGEDYSLDDDNDQSLSFGLNYLKTFFQLVSTAIWFQNQIKTIQNKKKKKRSKVQRL